MPINIEALLQPISGGDPCGADLRYLPVTPLIKEARRQEADLSQGVWKHDIKVADFPLVLKLGKEALTKQGKDLQVAAWLTEALLRQEGFAGLRQGLDLIRRMLETYWDGVHPRPDEDGDLVMRATALRWVGSQLDPAVRSAPVTKAGHNWYQYRESRSVPTEEEAQSNPDKLALRNEAIQDGKITPEEFESGFAATPGAWCLELYKSLGSLMELVTSLGSFCDEKFGDEAPEFGSLNKSLEEIHQTARVLMKLKGVSEEQEKEPEEPAEPGPEADVAEPAAPVIGQPQTSAPAPAPAPKPARPATAVSAEPSSREDAVERVVAAARYLRKENPYNPAGYLVTRGLRWGELRATGTNPHPLILVAPPSEARVGLKQLAAEGVWDRTLEAAEEAAGRPWGRAWLDIHRYSVGALQSAGIEAAAKAILSGLKALLTDMPLLLQWTLADDTPVANAETVQWFKDQGVFPGAEPPPEPEPPADTAPVPKAQPEWYPPPPMERTPQDGSGEPAPPDAYDLAMDAARSGRTEEALNILSREVGQERSGRGRFLRRVQLAQVCMATGNNDIGRPILQELAEEIERRGLEHWENPDLVAQPLVLLYRCLDDPQDPAGDKRKLYAQICRLDPSRALGLR
jgi:type VI secretion system protein ImpA